MDQNRRHTYKPADTMSVCSDTTLDYMTEEKNIRSACVLGINDLSRNSPGVWSHFNITGCHYRCSLPLPGFNEYVSLAPATSITQTIDVITVTAATFTCAIHGLSPAVIPAPAGSLHCKYCVLRSVNTHMQVSAITYIKVDVIRVSSLDFAVQALMELDILIKMKKADQYCDIGKFNNRID